MRRSRSNSRFLINLNAWIFLCNTGINIDSNNIITFFFAGQVIESSEKCDVRGNKQNGFTYNCNHKGFTTIPSDFAANTVGISMAYNALKFIPDKAFSHLPQLQWLDLSYNTISYIRPSAFANCTSLTVLNIDGNSLNCTSSSVPLDVLIDLRGLKEFRTINSRLCRDKAFFRAVCVYLKELTIYSTDLLNGRYFPTNCKNLTSLRSLQLNAVEPVKLKNATLQGLTGLPIRDIVFVGHTFILHPIEADFFKPVENATNLFITYESRKADVSYALRILIYPYRNKSMESLVLTKIRDLAAIELKYDDFQILKTICVKKLSLTDSNIIQTNFNRMIGSTLWSCLKEVDISGNMEHRFYHSFAFFLSTPRVTKLNMCCQRIIRANLPTSSGSIRKESRLENTTKNMYGMHPHNISLTLHCSDSLEWVSFSHIDWRRNVFDFDLKFNAKNMIFMDASSLLMANCRGRLLGMPALTILRIQMWDCASINPEFISHLTSVTNLTFSSLNLGQNVLTKPLFKICLD